MPVLPPPKPRLPRPPATGPAAPRRRPGRPRDVGLTERRQAEILHVAARVFARHGYKDTDVQVVADEVGVGKGTIYRYFPTKEQLFLAAVDNGMAQLVAEMEALRATRMEPFDQLEKAVRTYIRFFDEHPEYAELLIQERAEFRSRKASTYFAYRERGQQVWHGQIRELIAAGRLRDMPPERLTDVIGALLYGTMFTRILSGRRKHADAEVTDLLDIVFHGIATERERATNPRFARVAGAAPTRARRARPA